MIGLNYVQKKKSTLILKKEGCKNKRKYWINYCYYFCVPVVFVKHQRKETSLPLTIFHILGEGSGVDDQSQEQTNNWKRVKYVFQVNIRKKYPFAEDGNFVLTACSESIDGHSVVLVFLVGISTPQTQTSQECTKEISHETNDHQSCGSTNISGTVGSSASRFRISSKGQRGRSTRFDTLGEETFPPSIGLNPTGISQCTKE